MTALRAAIIWLALLGPALAQNNYGTPNVPTGGGSGGGGGGGVTSLSTSCPSQAGQPLTGAVSLPFGIAPVSRSPIAGATDTILTGDCGQTIEYTDAAPIAITVPQAGSTGFLSGFVVSITIKSGAGPATFTTTTSIFSSTGATTLVLNAGQSATFQSDGTNWNVYSGIGLPNTLGFPGYQNTIGTWYANPYSTTSAPGTSGTGTQFSFYCTPLWIYQPVHIEGLAVRIIGTSAGNNLAGAIYKDCSATGVCSGTLHRPGALVDFTPTAFVTTTTGGVGAALNNASDALTAGMYWGCVQRNDTTVTYGVLPSGTTIIASIIGDTTVANVAGSAFITHVSTTGTAFNGANWINFTSGTAWTIGTATLGAPNMAIEIFSVP